MILELNVDTNIYSNYTKNDIIDILLRKLITLCVSYKIPTIIISRTCYINILCSRMNVLNQPICLLISSKQFVGKIYNVNIVCDSTKTIIDKIIDIEYDVSILRNYKINKLHNIINDIELIEKIVLDDKTHELLNLY
jgi:hypothetical protein